MTEQELDTRIADIKQKISEIDQEEKKLQSKRKPKSLSHSRSLLRSSYRRELDKLLKEKENFGKNATPAATATPAEPTTKPVTVSSTVSSTKSSTPSSTPRSTPSSTEKGLAKVEIKAQETANELNNDELATKKTEDAKSAAETARDRASQVDANIEENVPTWFWKEAREMAPTSKAKRGFIITNHILNRLGTALGNTGAIIQNAGGSGGASLKEHGGSYIDQYRQNKLEQAIANRKTRQNNLLQQQIDALIAIGASENEARAIQNRLRNSSFWNKYNRLTNEQQVYIQGILYNDTKGKITDAALGNFIDQLMEGKNVSLEQAAVNMMAAEGIDNIDEIKSGAKAIGDKVIKWLNWDKPGQ